MMINRFNVVIWLAGSMAVCFGHSIGAPAGVAGAPDDDGTCVLCHTGNLNSGPGSVTITFPDPNGWVAGQKYSLSVKVADPTAKRWGFELTNRKEASNLFEGVFAVPSGSNSVQVETRLGTQEKYATHTVTGTFPQQVTQAGWSIDWTAPVAGTGPIRFYAAGNAANGNGTESGDQIYSSFLSVPEQTSTPPAITTGNTVIPQFVFGGGWYSALYFTNESAAQVTFNVNLYTDAATLMTLGGSSFKTVLIPAGGTAIVEAQNNGPLSQGWATFDLPAGVTGYGVFRQTVAGRVDQEAIVPFASSAGTKQLLTFDQTAYTTALAVWFNGSTAGTVTLAAFDPGGNSLGTAVLTMQPGTKLEFPLADQIPAVAAQRGSVIVSTSSGSVAALGLRFGGYAFTSIPAVPLN